MSVASTSFWDSRLWRVTAGMTACTGALAIAAIDGGAAAAYTMPAVIHGLTAAKVAVAAAAGAGTAEGVRLLQLSKKQSCAAAEHKTALATAAERVEEMSQSQLPKQPDDSKDDNCASQTVGTNDDVKGSCNIQIPKRPRSSIPDMPNESDNLSYISGEESDDTLGNIEESEGGAREDSDAGSITSAHDSDEGSDAWSYVSAWDSDEWSYIGEDADSDEQEDGSQDGSQDDSEDGSEDGFDVWSDYGIDYMSDMDGQDWEDESEDESDDESGDESDNESGDESDLRSDDWSAYGSDIWSQGEFFDGSDDESDTDQEW